MVAGWEVSPHNVTDENRFIFHFSNNLKNLQDFESHVFLRYLKCDVRPVSPSYLHNNKGW